MKANVPKNDNAALIRNRYRSFLRSVKKYMTEEEQAGIRKAIRHLVSLPGGEMSFTGEPYLVHAMNVARIVMEQMSMGMVSVIGALYHDISRIRNIPPEYFDREFGPHVKELIKGLNKISGLDPHLVTVQSENFRQLILNLAGDIRVILIRLAEQLELMRHLEKVPQKDQVNIATGAYYLYAPLAHRLGLYNLKSELEDLSMKYLEPEAYEDIRKKIAQTKAARNRLIRDFIDPLKKRLEAQGLRFTIRSRLKSVHSIWDKMKKQNVGFDEVYDIFAVRIILDSQGEREKEDCWKVYSIVTDLYTPNPKRLRDWISIPKSNGYESLHTTVAGPSGKWIEVQIRTTRMDEIAEKGYAAHWKYKEGGREQAIDEWLRNVREILENYDPRSEDIVDQMKLNLYSKEIFVFTPKGDVMRLPEGATLLDFAFAIHSEVGRHCTGGKIDNRVVPLHHTLQTGDRVEVITVKSQKPAADWLAFVRTSKARSKIKQSLNEEQMKAAAHGREMLMRRLRNWKIPFSDETVKKLLQHYRTKLARDLYAGIADEEIDLLEIKEILTAPQKKESEEPKSLGDRKTLPSEVRQKNEDFLLVDGNMKNVDYTLARCCNPIFGDPVFGFVTISEGIKIHRQDCPNAKWMKEKYPYRIIPVRWTTVKDKPSFEALIRVTGTDEIGIVNRITELLSNELDVNIRSISFSEKKGGFEGRIKVVVANADHLEVILHRLMRVKGITKASRYGEG
ncbi:MAG TPA: bifunctional (p)ppGpp synthetase/guanosine-3',5'-bis(diphosphate) 3'-pyrophosphohydrolase [Bacteroidetes bacterium]|nr:bifunctional (p)ppGpp synthetase/guanosine-3',5'-bis(diphosphate) 3'-pyrophosphohydrolase [Bacteroidota bacterium]